MVVLVLSLVYTGMDGWGIGIKHLGSIRYEEA